ncbi:MAG: hypothetical protein HYS65_17940 [Betaproteobacteria bacterium]|nr:hypothetical protein [Betaproteobacteria bacterium]
MIAVNGQLAVCDAGDAQLHLLAALVFEHHLRAEPAMFRRHVVDVVGESQLGLMLAEAVARGQRDFNTIADLPAFESALNFLEQRAVDAVHVADRHIVLLEKPAGLVEDRIGEVNHPVARDGILHGNGIQ